MKRKREKQRNKERIWVRYRDKYKGNKQRGKEYVQIAIKRVIETEKRK